MKPVNDLINLNLKDMLKPKPTFREIQLKLNAHYVKQPKPKHIKLLPGAMALRNSIEVVLHPHSPVKL